ncbi:MAG: Ig-like domain-containing protein [Terracidiphilus sp.]|nr:Ig-like domain-containing protein [Terracidiphilus sp.]
MSGTDGALLFWRNSSGDLEQVHVKGMIRRGLRLETVAGLGIALAIGAFATMAYASGGTTATTLNVTTHDSGGRTKATVKVSVAADDGLPASGAVSILEGTKTLAGVVLDADGQATANVTLAGGDHALRAVYTGDTTHTASTSITKNVQAMTGASPSFTLSYTAVSPSTLPMTLTAGTAGTVKVTITPVNNAALSAPMFVTLSCSGLPDQASCSFSPATIEILSTTPASCATGAAASACPPSSTMVLQTQAGSTVRNAAPAHSPIAWAILLPGILGLGGLAWGTRRRRWLSRISLLVLVAFVATLGTTGCAPRYDYYHHGPDPNLPTPSGSYTVTITGQSSDNITAITSSTTLALTVQ